MENYRDLPSGLNGYDHELCLLIKEMKDMDDHGFKQKLIGGLLFLGFIRACHIRVLGEGPRYAVNILFFIN